MDRTGAVEVQALEIPDVKLIATRRLTDRRGSFSEVYSRAAFHAAGISVDFVQENHSRSAETGTVRGLHFQAPPFAQDKLVRVVAGAILDVAVDLRRQSPSFGRHVAVRLSAGNWTQLFVPIGFGHGFCTLEPDTEVLYKVSNYYSAPHDRGIRWNDPDLGIAWPVAPDRAVLSDRDSTLPQLAQAGGLF
ncbi:MAG: dTDP-4-dehydrorhamnose 3,5-epimerase [Azospirillum sp.]|nr:dTDP-4-dehydrorhamnose 3,5-epimerase [Azospirillum sp.]